jgi:hypothetical protein
MIIRPGPTASKDENVALERLARLRAVIRQLQPATDADIKTTIRWWIGGSLPDYVAALGKPAVMREWITGQVTTRAGRPGHSTYDTPGTRGGLWSGASPEGLLTARDGEHRTETLTPWAEIPAWIASGISQCRERLLASAGSNRAIIRRQLGAAARTLAVPGDQQDKEKEQAARMLGEALDASSAAIDAAPAPTPGPREQTCRIYEEDASPVQELLFGDEALAGRPGHEAGKPGRVLAAEPGQSPPVPQETGASPQPAGRPAAPLASRTLPAPARQPDAPMGTGHLHGTPTTKEEEIMPPAPAAEPVPATKPILAAAATPEAAAEPRRARALADRDDEVARLTQQLDGVLTAILEHGRPTAPGAGSTSTSTSTSAGFADIRAAFASLRGALDLPADGTQADRGNAVPGPAPAQPPPATTARHARPAPKADALGDIRAGFIAIMQALDLPAQGRHIRAAGPSGADAASGRLLDQAAAEAQACARWYQDTPEWQRITTVSRAARDLITEIRRASGDYWTEIRQDIRVRGCIRTVAARASLAISGAAHVLASRLEKSGHKDTRIWRAAWGLHRATATFADRVMRYTPSRSPDRMDEVRHIINDLGQRQRHSTEPGPSRAAGSRSREAGTTSAAALGMEGFPLTVSPATIRLPTASGARTVVPPLRQAHGAHRS